jgi:phage terminase small subunit
MAKKALKPRRPNPRTELTLKQRSFCVWYYQPDVNGNGTEAARRANYKGNDATLARVAYENLRKPLIIAELAKYEKELLKNAEVTIEKVLHDLEDQRTKALGAGQYAPAVRCSELQGKYLKMFVDKIEHVQTIEDVSNEELARLLREIAEVGGIDFAALIAGNDPAHSMLPDTPGAPTTH